MNKKIVVVLILTVITLILLAFYSFGPLLNSRTSSRPNPISLQPINTEKVVVNNQNLTLISFNNKDIVQNFYTIKFPQDWHIQAGKDSGSYDIKFNGGSGQITLTDVADNTTLELMVLSQEEPNLKKTASNYKRLDYKKITINGNDAYQLIYQSSIGQTDYQTIQTYISGPDKAGIVTLIAPKANFDSLQPTFLSVINNFQWDSK